MLLLVPVGLLLSLEGGAAPGAAQRRQPTRDTTPTTARRTYTSIRQVDFNNFVYSIPSPIGVSASIKGDQITMRQGIGRGSNPESGCEYRVESVSYGYLISDAGPDAVIVLGCSLTPGNAYNNAGYIYSLRQGQPTLVAQFEGGFRGHLLIVGAGIAYANLIVIKDDWDENPPLQAITYKWNGRKLIEAGRSSIQRIQ